MFTHVNSWIVHISDTIIYLCSILANLILPITLYFYNIYIDYYHVTLFIYIYYDLFSWIFTIR